MGRYNENTSEAGDRNIVNLTPFGGKKSSNQSVQFSIDPSKGLTKERYLWYSNGTLHDSVLFSEDPGEITLATTATGTDDARIHSAYAGQYISQTLAEPGLGAVLSSDDVTYDADDRVSLTHGLIDLGAYWRDAGAIDTGLALRYTDTDAQIVLRSGGSHQADSPVPQPDWSIDPMDGSGPSGLVLRPDEGNIPQFPFTWYNQGALYVGLISPEDGEIILLHKFEVEGEPSLETPNLPVQAYVSNEGTADTLEVGIGGMQYGTYGAEPGDILQRDTAESRITTGSFIGDQVATTENAIDPSSQPGAPLVSIQRDSTARDLQVIQSSLTVDPDNDIYLFFWDEWDPSTALTGATFNDVVSRNDPNETLLLSDTQATDYTPTDAVIRGSPVKAEGGNKNVVNLLSAELESRIPIGATRVVTAVHDGSTADVSPFITNFFEGY